jgi:hypothetical protein
MHNFLFTALFFLFSAHVISQEIVGSAGKEESNTQVQIYWTLGETVIQTGGTGEQRLTQGFHQIEYFATLIEEKNQSNIEFTLYPNPFIDVVNIAIKGDATANSLNYALIDMNGRELKSGKMISNPFSLEFSAFSSAYYLIRIFSDNNSVFQTYKVQKQ